jgi:hypothetical protein
MTDPTRSTTPPPSSNQSSTALATTIVGLYVLSEAQILGGITSILRRTPATLAGRQAAVPRIRRLVRQVVARLVYTSNDLVRQMVTAAVEEGSRDAIASVSKALVGRGGFTPPPGSTGGAGGSSGSGRALTVGGEPFDLSMPHGERAAQAIRNDIESELQDVRFRITRLPEDIYKAIAPHGAIGQVLANGFTGAQAQAVAWRVFVSQGVTGFTDKSGRDWALSSYVEMAVRTASMRAYNASHLARMHALGIHYFTVSDDGHPCPLCFPWEGKVLTDGHVADPEMPVDGTIGDATAAGLFHPNCFPGFVSVSAPSGVSAADSRWYEGELVVVHTALGNELSVTPNHPILTPEGWVAAGALEVGQHVVSYNGEVERVNDMSPDDQQVPASIGEVFDALRHSSGVTTVSVPSSAEQFHGDGSDSEVEIVLVDRLLQDGAEPDKLEGNSERPLFVGGMRFGSLLADGSLHKVVRAASHTSDGRVGASSDGQTLSGGHTRHSAFHDFTEVGTNATRDEPLADLGLSRSETLADLALGHSGGLEGDRLVKPDGLTARREPLPRDAGETSVDGLDADADGGRDLARALASRVTPDYVIGIERRVFAGHVYNLQSGDGWYVAGSIVVHNCRHVLTAVLPGFTVLPPPREWTPEMAQQYLDTQKQRRLEVAVRKAKRALEYAYTPAEQKRARADVTAAQAKVRQFVNANEHLVRQSRREQLNLTDAYAKLPVL